MVLHYSVRGTGAGKMSEKKNQKKTAAEGDRRLDFCLKSFYDKHDSPTFMQTLVRKVARAGPKKIPTKKESGVGGTDAL
jgi:hypothetical protein